MLSEFLFISLLGLFIRYGISSNSYSGMATPPMYGDYEAQRHWLEITSSLPLEGWYINSTDNDLLYWGLDYPPLTAYHSLALGKVAQVLEPDLVALHTSRGYESSSSKLFMRMTVIIADLLIFFPAVYLFSKSFRQYHSAVIIQSIFLILQPGFYLIDHGHFQYNCICLGFALLSCALILINRPYLGTVSFCLALTYKQIALYYAPAFFFFLLGQAIRSGRSSGYTYNTTLAL